MKKSHRAVFNRNIYETITNPWGDARTATISGALRAVFLGGDNIASVRVPASQLTQNLEGF